MRSGWVGVGTQFPNLRNSGIEFRYWGSWSGIDTAGALATSANASEVVTSGNNLRWVAFLVIKYGIIMGI